MEEDQQMVVLLKLNLGAEETMNSSWQNDISSTAHSTSGHKSGESDAPETHHDHLEKDFEFLRRHASGADPDFLHSLLNSQVDNPKRLETVMSEMLNIPNALELVQEFRRNYLKVGEKRPNAKTREEPKEEAKRSKTKDTDTYLQQVREMFPDADGLFLISECQQLESWEDFSRFINTVMISGLYPKKEAVEYSPSVDTSRVNIIVNNNLYRNSVNYSSEDEISSSGLIDTPRKRRRRRRQTSNSSDGSLRLLTDESAGLQPPQVDLIDIASDNTETYDPPDPESLQEMYNNWNGTNNLMEVEDVVPVEEGIWPQNLKDKAGPNEAEFSGDDGFLSFSSSPEKSLAEIIEESRRAQRPSNHRSDSLPGPSTSQDSLPEGSNPPAAQPATTSSEQDDEEAKKSEEWLDEQTANLIRIFPNTDPSYLREEVAGMGGSSEAVNEFVISKLEKNDMPTRAEYEKKLEMEELQNRYTKNFSIEDFLKAIPDPWKYFTEDNRQCAEYKSHSLCYLKRSFRRHYVRTIIDVFNKNKNNLYLSYQELKGENMKKRTCRRSEFECNQSRPTTINIQFLQEVAFIENEEKIKDYLEAERIEKQIRFDEAKRTGSLLECQCCFDSEVMVQDTFYCPKDHAFCKECIVKSVEVEMGNGKYQFGCLANCDENFTLACLQNVLKPELFSKVIQAIQTEEVRAAGIEDLVQCPFCNYATILPPEEKVMTCLNPECLKESCRLCKELNHIPLRCDEVEKSEEVKMRTYIENKMTEALVRTCYKCGKKFVKEDGCNKMTCTCGAKMCYVCRKPVSDYTHFNAQGGTEYHKCPLYSKNDELHVDLVRWVGEEAKAEILQANPQAKLIHDPTIIMPERTAENGMPGMVNGAALALGLRAIRGEANQEGEEGENPRREIRREMNPYYNRYHRHRHRPQVESEEEEEEEIGEGRHRHDHDRHDHHQPRNAHHRRHRHQEMVHEHRRHRHHHHHFI